MLKQIKLNLSVVLPIIIIAAVLFLVALTAVLHLRTRTLDRAETNIRNFNIALAAQTDGIFRSTAMLASEVTNWILANPNASTAEINAELLKKKDIIPSLSGIAIADNNGILIGSITINKDTPKIDLSFREWFAYHKNNPNSEMFIGDPIQSIISPNRSWLIPLSFPVRNKDDKLVAVISMPLYPSFFSDFFHELELGEGAAITLQKHDSTVLTRVPFDENILGKKFPNGPITTALKEKRHAIVYAKSQIDGNKRIISGYKLNNFPLSVAVSLNKNVILTGWQIQVWFIAISTAILLSLLIILAKLLLRLHIQTNSLQEAQNKLTTAQHIARLGSWEYDLVQGNIEWSDETRRIFAEPLNTTITLEQYLTIIHPEDRHLIQTMLEKMQHGMGNYDVEYRLLRKDGQIRHVHEKAIGVYSLDGKLLKLSGTIMDITERKEAEITVIRHQNILSAQDRLRSKFIENKDPKIIFTDLLEDILMTTESQYGYIGEVLYENNVPYLRTHAISNIAWNDETRALYESNCETGFAFRNLKSLFGSVITTGKMVISNDPAHDPRACGIPNGHPPLNAFLGIPIYYGAEMLGQIGLANRAGGYNQKIVTELMPIVSACGQIIAAINDHAARIDAENNLKKRSNELEKSNSDLESFAYVASHDLREPLRTVSNYIGLLDRRYGDKFDDDAKEFVRLAKEGAVRLDRMVVELLEYSRIGRGDKELVAVDSQKILNIALENLYPVINESNTVINTESTMPIIKGNANDIVRLFQNVIANAIKYRRSDIPNKLDISCHHENNMWHFIFKDNGIGISQEHNFNEKIFKIFQRLHGKNAYGGGSGIGLAICRKIVELLGGKIWVESAGENQGTAFHLTIPV